MSREITRCLGPCRTEIVALSAFSKADLERAPQFRRHTEERT
jgi:hypothetical protein